LEVFPKLFDALIDALKQPLVLGSVLDERAPVSEGAGCYVVLEGDKPIYVGIARNIRRRLRDHLSGDPSRANLAVRITAKRLGVTLSRIKKHPDFNEEFQKSCDLLKGFYVGWVDIENPLEMYIFEPYCAMKLDTHEFNFFDTLQILAPRLMGD
jgi:predicted GIY-YIG superfamily endonuclease